MEKYNIKFRSIDEIVDFVRWGDGIDKNMDLSAGVLSVDAKSLIGIIAVGLNKDLTLLVHGQLADKEKSFLNAYLS